jgi:hemerythrin
VKGLLIVWRDVNQTGIPIIDEQHRGIVSIINSVHDSLGTKREEAILEPATGMLLAYTRLHFRNEHDLLEESGYPGLKEHDKLHEKLIADMSKHFRESKKGNDTGIMLGFLKGWWLDHINREDMLYKEHLRAFLGLDK